MNSRTLSLIAGISYLIIFFTAIFSNFLVLESLRTDPMMAIQENGFMVRIGIISFMFTVVFDVVVAWALYELYKAHYLSVISTFFRMMHAAIMAVALFALPLALTQINSEDILVQLEIFNTIWLIGLFFFGIHLIFLSRILGKPRLIVWFLLIAGLMYMVDTCAHFLLPDYEEYSAIFLTLVAIPSIIGEMSFAIWLLFRKQSSN